MSSRAHISLKTEKAALLCQLRDEQGNLLIAYEHAKVMTEDQVISLFHRDHYPIRKVDGGPDVHWNLVHRFKGEHRKKTSEVDVPEIRKADRLSAEQVEFRRRMLMPAPERKEQKRSRWAKGRKLQSRNTFERREQ